MSELNLDNINFLNEGLFSKLKSNINKKNKLKEYRSIKRKNIVLNYAIEREKLYDPYVTFLSTPACIKGVKRKIPEMKIIMQKDMNLFNEMHTRIREEINEITEIPSDKDAISNDNKILENKLKSLRPKYSKMLEYLTNDLKIFPNPDDILYISIDLCKKVFNLTDDEAKIFIDFITDKDHSLISIYYDAEGIESILVRI